MSVDPFSAPRSSVRDPSDSVASGCASNPASASSGASAPAKPLMPPATFNVVAPATALV